jgi:hypothetical protein
VYKAGSKTEPMILLQRSEMKSTACISYAFLSLGNELAGRVGRDGIPGSPVIPY